MDLGIHPWQRDWVIDPDPLAVAQARHRPSGYGVTIKTIGGLSHPDGRRPFLAVYYSDDSRSVLDQKFHELGFEASRSWTSEMNRQARELWCALGFDVDHTAAAPPGFLCEVTRWRDQWSLGGGADPALPHLAHASGYAVRFVHSAVADSGRTEWLATTPAAWADRSAQAEAVLGTAAVERLQQEAHILWMEQGYFDVSPSRLARAFGEAWRTLWGVKEREGEQWLVHISGLAVTPVYGVVDAEGGEAWMLHVQSGDVFELDYLMRSRVGEKAWQRLHDQGWALCVELGYVEPSTIPLDILQDVPVLRPLPGSLG